MAILLSDDDYILRAGVPFLVPVHPGAAPDQDAGTAAQLAAAIRAYSQALADVTLCNRLGAALTAIFLVPSRILTLGLVTYLPAPCLPISKLNMAP